MFRAFDISASALTMQKLRMDVIAQNIANAQTTRTETGQPYRRKVVVVKEDEFTKPFSQYLAESGVKFSGSGVKVTRVQADPTPFKRIYDPGHPDADEEGYVLMPNVDTVREMVDMISATRSYEANVTAFNASKNLAMKALEIGR
ncbi:MAG: flagellar basal body rod protein FlgC [Clostridiales bacterium]|nr:flagellar basal body rod protein FlgC [Clostridiales bacterium]